MAPPTFAELGSQARNIFSSNYNFSLVKLDCRTKSSGGMDFAVRGYSNLETGNVNSSLESKYKVPQYGVTIKETWTTDNVLVTELAYDDKAFKCSVDGTLVPQTGTFSSRVKSTAKFPHLSVNLDMDVDRSAPVFHTAAVMDFRGWYAGAQASIDALKRNILKNSFAVGYATDDLVLHTNVNNGQEFGGSVYQKVNENLQTGVQLAWSAGNNATTFGLGCTYYLDNDTSLKAKVNNSSQIGLGLSHRLREGIQINLSALIDGRSFNQGGHKFGCGIEFDV